MKSHIYHLSIFLFFIISTGNICASVVVDSLPEINKSGWITTAFGANTLGGASGILELSTKRDNKIYAGRLQGGSGGNSFAEAALLFGRSYPSDDILSIISAGPSITASGNGSGGRGTDFGFAVGVQTFIRYTKFGLGIYITGNISRNSSNAAITLGFQFGNFKKNRDTQNPFIE